MRPVCPELLAAVSRLLSLTLTWRCVGYPVARVDCGRALPPMRDKAAVVRRPRGGNVHGHHWIRDEKRAAIYARDDHRCVYCWREDGADLGQGDGVLVARLTLDHLQPRELGGSNDATNLVTACLTCNSSRKSTSLRAWFRKLREQGIGTGNIAARVRRQTSKPLRYATEAA